MMAKDLKDKSKVDELILTISEKEDNLFEALRNGASGYLRGPHIPIASSCRVADSQ